MNNMTKRIVTLIPSATEIVSFLGVSKSIVGKSHECDFPKKLNKITKLTYPKIKVDGSSKQIHNEINTILKKTLSVYDVDIKKLKKLKPNFIVTQAHCEVCAVSLKEVEKITNKHLGENTSIISLQPHNLNEIFYDIRRVAKKLNIYNDKNKSSIHQLTNRLKKINKLSKKIRNKKKIACIEWTEPLMVAGNWIPEIVELAGGKDVLGKSKNNSHWIKFNDLKKTNPDIIIFIPCGFNIMKTKYEVDILLNKSKYWNSLKAFKKQEIYIADGNQFFNRPGPRIVESTEILAEIINPEIFNYKHKNKGWINYFESKIKNKTK